MRDAPLLHGPMRSPWWPLSSAALLGAILAGAEPPIELRYTRPATRWTEALPVGNGRLGAMVFGDASCEHLQLNEASLWSGGPGDWNNPEAREFLPQVRAAVFAGDYVKAGDLCKKMQGPYNESYQPLGDLWLSFPDAGPAAAPSAYTRALDLDRGVASVRYREGNANFEREVFSSFPDQVIVVRLTCDQPDGISFRASADTPLRYAAQTNGEDTIVVRGRAPAHVDPSYLLSKNPIRYDDRPGGEGMTFEMRVSVLAEGGSVTCGGSTLAVARANAVTILISAGTSFNGPDKSPGREGRDPSAEAKRPLDEAREMTYADLLARHVADYQKLFRRVAID